MLLVGVDTVVIVFEVLMNLTGLLRPIEAVVVTAVNLSPPDVFVVN